MSPRSVAKVPRNLTSIIFETYLPDNILFLLIQQKKINSKNKKISGRKYVEKSGEKVMLLKN